MVDDPNRIPVLIGAGQINDRPPSPDQGLDSLGLMLAAAKAAEADAGGVLLHRVDWLGIVSQISFPNYTGRLVEAVSKALDIAPRYAHETPMPTGDSPILLINQAANAIGRGETQVALVVGAEALRTASQRAAAAAAAAGGKPQKRGPLPAHTPTVIEPRHRYGLNVPTEVYALYENACRAAYGQSLAEGQAESGRIWAAFSRVAAANEAAWIRKERTAEDIVCPSADNRLITFPFTKLMVANASVNQGAAVLVTSLAVARAVGVPEDTIIYVGKGAAAHEDEDPFNRPDFARSAGMRVSLERALSLNGLSIGEIDHIELYSCFPCVPKMAARILGWPEDRPASVFGGLTFGGGPIGNYMTHAVASMMTALRRSGRYGLLFANGGYATHNHTIVLSKVPQPAGLFPQEYDFQAEADAVREPVPMLDEAYRGPATIETYTVLYDRDGAPRFGVVIGRNPDGHRVIGRVPRDDAKLIEALTSGAAEPIGMKGVVSDDGSDAPGTARWRMN